MLNEFSRTEMLIGKEALEKLKNSKVAVFGVGGVGGYVVEGLARSGVGSFILIDNDVVALTNLNRQIIATHKTIGRAKVEVGRERILDINPQAEVITYNTFYMPGSGDDILDSSIDYIVDAIDTVSAKIDLVLEAKKHNIPIISSMGMGNKLDPTMIEITDIYKTSICPLAKVMRKELRARGIDSLKVAFSREEPITPINLNLEKTSKRSLPGSISFVPSAAGLIIAGQVIKDLIS